MVSVAFSSSKPWNLKEELSLLSQLEIKSRLSTFLLASSELLWDGVEPEGLIAIGGWSFPTLSKQVLVGFLLCLSPLRKYPMLWDQRSQDLEE